jgi:hypothetical protein
MANHRLDVTNEQNLIFTTDPRFGPKEGLADRFCLD